MPRQNTAEGIESDVSYESESDDGYDQLEESGAEQYHRPKKGELFRDKSNQPVNFYMHKSLKKPHTIEDLTADITENGGRVVHDLKNAMVVLISLNYTMGKTLQASYETARDANLHKIYVKPAPFVAKCIRENRFYLYTPETKKMRGIPPGLKRTEFTEEDDEDLCYYLSRLIPEKEAGGRTGYNIYRLLVEMAISNPDLYSWASRHTFESWRNRYKKHRTRMDNRIAVIVEENPPTQKQLWPEDRRLNRPRRIRHFEEEEEEEEEVEVEAAVRQAEDIGSGTEETAHRNKRPRPRRSSNRTEPPAKRSRLRSSPSRNEAQRPLSRKGKERAFETDENDGEKDYDAEYEYLFAGDFDEPGPSPRMGIPPNQRSPVATPDFLTQNTLVSATPREIREREKSPQSDENRPPPSPLPSPTLIPPESELQSPSVRKSGPSAPIPSPSPTRVQLPVDTPGPQTSSPTAKKAPSPTLSNTGYLRPQMAARRPASVRKPIIDNFGPSRNTRSRSQVPEEIVQPLPQRKKAKKQEAISEVIEPSEHEVDQQQPAVSPGAQRAQEIFDDERHANKPNDETEVPPQRPVREASMDTDDAQTKRDLSGPSNTSSSSDINPLDILQRLRTKSSKSQGAGSRSRQSLYTNSRLGLRSPNKSLQTPNRDPVTPVKRYRAGTSSSAESFPLSGTKASAMKKRLQQQEKSQPYKPPRGTRAALLAERK